MYRFFASWVLFFWIAPCRTFGQTVTVDSFSVSGEITWLDTYSNGTYQVQWASSPTGGWYSSWSNLTGKVATGGVLRSKVPLLYRVLWTSNAVQDYSGFFEDFEDVHGWTNHAQGAWTNNAHTGKWISDKVYTVSAPGRARSGLRAIGIDECTSRTLELPVTDSPTNISFWARHLAGPPNYINLRLEEFDGVQWNDAGVVGKVQYTNYSYFSWKLALPIPNPGQRLRINRFDSSSGCFTALYLDDLTIETAP